MTEVKRTNYPSKKIIGKEKNYELILLWMLNNNIRCGWRDFLDKRIGISQSTLSNNLKKLINNNFVEKFEEKEEGKKKKFYKITERGKKRYEDILIKKKSPGIKINYPPNKYLSLKDNEINILYILHNNASCRWKDFLAGPFKINQSVLLRILKKFESQTLIEKVKDKDSRFEVYQITEKGTSKYISRLKSYKLDRQSILEEESKKIQEIFEFSEDLFKSFDISNDDIKYRLLNNILSIDLTRVQGTSCTEDDFKKILYFISINHPEEYPNYITPEKFSQKYKIDLTTLNFFLKEIVDKNQYSAKYFRLKIIPDKLYYFQAGEEFEKILRALTINIIKKLRFLSIQNKDQISLETPLSLSKIQEGISKKLIKGYFHKSLKSSIITFLPDYIEYLKFIIQMKEEIKTTKDRLKIIAFRDVSVESRDESSKFQESKLRLPDQESNKLILKTLEKEKKLEFLQIALDEMDNVIRLKPYKIENYHRKIDLLIESGKNNEALEIAERAIILGKVFKTKRPDLSHNYKARILNKLRHYDEAVEAINKAIEIYPDWHLYYYDKANYIHHSGKKLDALVAINQAIEKNPKSENSYQLKAIILKSLRKFEEAIKTINQVIQINNEWWGHHSVKGDILLNMGEYRKSLNAINKAIDLAPDNVSLYTDKANCFSQLRKFKDAIVSFDKAIDLDPDNISLYTEKAHCFSQLGKFKDAIVSFDKAIEISKKSEDWDDWDLYNSKLEIFIESKDYESALKFIESVPKEIFNENDNLIMKAEVLIEKGKYIEALAHTDDAIKLLPDDPWGYDLKFKCLKKMERYEESLEVYMKIFELDFSWIDFGEIFDLYFELEKTKAFFDLVDEFLESEIDEKVKVDLHFEKLEAFLKLNKFTDSLKEINIVIEIEPHNPFIYIKKAYILRKLKKFELAIQEIEKAKKLDPLQHLIYYNEAKIYLSLRKYNEAIKSLKKGLDISYDFKKKYKYYIRLGQCYNYLKLYKQATSNYEKGKELADFAQDDKWIKKVKSYIDDLNKRISV